jgi:type II secretory pathway component PulL
VLSIAAKGPDNNIPTSSVHWSGQILDYWVLEQNSEDIKDIMAVVGKRERVNDCVVVDYRGSYY